MIKERHARKDSNRLIFQLCCYNIKSFRFYRQQEISRSKRCPMHHQKCTLQTIFWENLSSNVRSMQDCIQRGKLKGSETFCLSLASLPVKIGRIAFQQQFSTLQIFYALISSVSSHFQNQEDMVWVPKTYKSDCWCLCKSSVSAVQIQVKLSCTLSRLCSYDILRGTNLP